MSRVQKSLIQSQTRGENRGICSFSDIWDSALNQPLIPMLSAPRSIVGETAIMHTKRNQNNASKQILKHLRGCLLVFCPCFHALDHSSDCAFLHLSLINLFWTLPAVPNNYSALKALTSGDNHHVNFTQYLNGQNNASIKLMAVCSLLMRYLILQKRQNRARTDISKM